MSAMFSFSLMIFILFCIFALFSVVLFVANLESWIKLRQLSEQLAAEKTKNNHQREKHESLILELQTIFSTSLVGIILVRRGRIATANKRMAEMFGYNSDEIQDVDIRQFFSGRRAFRRFVRRHLHLLIEKNIEQVEYQLRKKDGTMIPCMLSGKAINASALAIGTVWVVEDISKIKATERELEQSRSAAEAASIAKGVFLANISHEIRTPMNGIIGLTQILLQGQLTETQRQHLLLIHKSSVRLMSIINDVLDYSKLESGRFELEQHPFSLRNSLQELAQTIEPSVKNKKLQFELNIDSSVPDIIVGNQTKVMQVFTNLVDNSLKFTSKGFVRVSVKIKMNHDDSRDKMLLCEVADTGIGILPVYHDKIFESFTQADASLSRKFGGTGLGLSISRGLVQLMGGDIWFESEPYSGSRFYFTLPLVANRTFAETPADTSGSSELSTLTPLGKGKKILVVEDEYINTVLITTLLTQSGYTVTSVQNGLEAVEVWRNEPFDCILMDIQMPEMDGYEAVSIIRAEEKSGEHVPIIAMTAHAMSSDRKKCLDSKMDDYIAKPISGKLVLRMIENHIKAKI